MYKYLTLLLILVNIPVIGKSLSIGYVDFRPYIYTDDHQVKGPIVNFAESIFKDFEIKFVSIPLKRVGQSLETGTINLYISVFKSEERQKLYTFSKHPYLKLYPAVCKVGNWKSKGDKLDISELYGKTFFYYDGTLEKASLFKN